MTDFRSYVDYLEELRAIGPWGLLVAVVLVWLIWPDRVDKLRTGILDVFGWLSASARKRAHASGIQTSLNPQIKALQQELGLQGLPSVAVHFTRSENGRPPEFRGGEVIVFVRDDMSNRANNVIRCALHYVNCTIATDARPLMSKPVERALDLVLAKRLIRGNLDAARQFTSIFLRDALGVDEHLRMIYGQVDTIEAEGWLPAILLNELAHLATSLPSALMYEPLVQQEVGGFVRFLSTIATREKGQPFQREYRLQHIDVHIMLLATDETLESSGLQVHVRQLASLYMQGVRSVYVLAAGHKAHLVDEFLTEVKSTDFLRSKLDAIDSRREFKHTRRGMIPRTIGYLRFRPRGT